MKSITISCIILFAALQIAAQEKQEIFFADPTIYVEGGKYYLTGTGGGKGGPGFSVLESTGLKSWAPPAGAKDSATGLYTFSVNENEVIVPVLE